MKPIIGINIAIWNGFLLPWFCKWVATAPVIGGKAAPPEMAATMREPPILVWRPRPRRVKIVAKQADSQQRTRQRRAMEASPWD
jgi:hypothetical protein